ncbi:hypothetical protein ACOZ38_30170 [Sphaerisporangium viridialbum]
MIAGDKPERWALGSAAYWLFGRRQDAGPLTRTQKRAIGPL